MLTAMTIQSFRDLVVWQRSMVLAEEVYALTEGFPRTEQFGLTFQIRKSAVSIPSNIAEGHARKHGSLIPDPYSRRCKSASAAM